MQEALIAIGVLAVMIAAMIWAHRVKARYLYGRTHRADRQDRTGGEEPGSSESTNDAGNQDQPDVGSGRDPNPHFSEPL